MKNKNGFRLLSEETVSTLVAVICVVFLVGLLIAIYMPSFKSEKTKQAGGSLNQTINAIKTGNTHSELNLYNPVGWSLFGFTLLVPNKCLREKCICICERANFIQNAFDTKAQIKKCDKSGACSAVPNLKNEDFEIKIDKGKKNIISILQVNEEVSITKKE